MQTHEDLAALFQRNLTLQNPPPPPEPIVQVTQHDAPMIYASVHYHHSGHLATQKVARPASDPGTTDYHTTEIILARHGVDISTLFPSQIELFKAADPSQQMRLVELWRISPNSGDNGMAQDLNHHTSLEQEEALAKFRLERHMLEERASRNQLDEDVMSDGEFSNAPLTPIQGGDGRWAVPHAEPYMMSGYESLAARDYEASAQPAKEIYQPYGSAVGGLPYTKATDPVYQQYPNPSHEWAQHTQQQQQAMENQYGAFTQQHWGTGVVIGGRNEDEEML